MRPSHPEENRTMTTATKPKRTAKTEHPDQIQIGHRAFHCCNPTCPDNRWPDGTRKLRQETHFDASGQCLSRD
jgi:hypothetical protein